MGSNIHIIHRGSGPWAKYPEEYGNSATLPRWKDSFEFMKLLWDDCISVSTCGCGDEHDYFCDYPIISRPKDFERFRLAAKDLQDWVMPLIDYLESEPNAYLEYD